MVRHKNVSIFALVLIVLCAVVFAGCPGTLQDDIETMRKKAGEGGVSENDEGNNNGGGLPVVTGIVTISGSAQVGQALTAVTDALDGSGAISYQWKRGGTNVGANSNTYTVQAADVGYTITVTVKRTGHSGSIMSEPTAVVVSIIVSLEMVWIPAGSFQMGSPAGESGRDSSETLHTVTLTSGFYMSNCQVTQEQYEAVMGYNPSFFQGASHPPASGETQGRRPVEQVSWYDAIEFCNALSEQEGLTPYYDIDKMQEDPNNTNEYDPYKWLITTNSAANGYRLPTEAQWEYACRVETTTAFNNGNNDYNDTAQVDEVAWHYYNSDYMTHEVGKKAANVWGLYDMHGNVWEWCWDWYNAAYVSDSFQTRTKAGATGDEDPAGASSGSSRVGRGGSWYGSAEYLRSAYRSFNDPYGRYGGIGFRLVRP